MRLWTVQDVSILEDLNNGKIYYPDFQRSQYVQKIPELNELYTFLLETFANLNNKQVSGLVFCFAELKPGIGITSIDNFYEFIISKKDALLSLWNHLNVPHKVILELEIEEEFLNYMFIDINDFQFLMPPIYPVPPYTTEDVTYIINRTSRGVAEIGKYPSGVMQAHIPYIKPEYVVSVYNMFDIN